MRNLTLLTDLYQLTMMYGYIKNNKQNTQAVFDMFFRKKKGEELTYAICAGLEQVVDLVNNIKFNDDDIEYLRSLELFDEDFFEYLSEFKFSGDIFAMKEGTVVFPMEPIVRVQAPICEAQFLETALLNIINHQTLIATKASRVVYASKGDPVLEFGLRRAQGPDAGIYGARAAIIGGCSSTSNVVAGQMFDVRVAGTHAHSWVMSFNSELEAFRAYAETFPTSCMLLVDTYDTIKSGIPNAIKVFDELKAKGKEPVGIRLDSGDLAYLSKKAREMLDKAGYPKARIFASDDLDENTIADLKQQGACIDVWGVGTQLITGGTFQSLGGVYKLSALIEGDKLTPKLKISENIIKITNPGKKKVVRLLNKDNMAIADLITLEDEVIDTTKPLTIFDPIEIWKKLTITDFKVQELLEPIMINGKQVYEFPSLIEIQTYANKQKEMFWDEFKRLKKPQLYKVDLSDKLYELKRYLLMR